jgi:hypothetical protein
MDGIRALLDAIRDHHLARGRVRGVFHLAIGRRVETPDGTLVSAGVTWRELANHLKAAKFDKELAREVGADPDTLSPRDREKMWYAAIALAKVGSPEASRQADELAARLKPLGFVVGPPPSGGPSASHPPPPAAKTAKTDEPKKPPDEGKKKKKK